VHIPRSFGGMSGSIIALADTHTNFLVTMQTD